MANDNASEHRWARVSNRIRIQFVGAAYHVNIKAVTGVRAFPDNHHRERFLAMLAAEIEKSDWKCLGYTILGTHFHVIVELQSLTLSSGFQRLNSAYARWFNKKHGRTGALWQARFFDVLIESDYQFLETQRYVALNAPRANLVENPEDWSYCHYGAVVGRYPKDNLVDEDAILRLLAHDRRQARLRLRAFVEETDRRRRRQIFLRAKSEQAQTVERTKTRSRQSSRKPIDS
jgi:putative transposase